METSPSELSVNRDPMSEDVFQRFEIIAKNHEGVKKKQSEMGQLAPKSIGANTEMTKRVLVIFRRWAFVGSGYDR
jgi:hypothetical protein